MNYEIVNLEKQLVKGFSIRTSNESGVGEVDIPTSWNKFYTEIYSQIENKQDRAVIGMYFDYESVHNSEYSFMPCVAVSNDSMNNDLETR